MKKFCAWLVLLALLAAAVPPAFAAETSPWALAAEEKPRREDLGKIPPFRRVRGTKDVGVISRWLRQAYVNGYYVNLRLFGPEGAGTLFQEQLEVMRPGESDLRMYIRQQSDRGGLMLQTDAEALRILSVYGIREIVVADRDSYIQAVYSVAELAALREALALRPGEQLCLGGEDDPVMIVSESGNRRYAEP